jgi:membrane associated rhomboid family serine protease
MLPIRDENPTRTFPVVNVTLIALNAVVFLIQRLGAPNSAAFFSKYGLTPIEITRGLDVGGPTLHPVYLTFLTSIFVHAGFAHIIGNMLYLWIFGDNVEDRMGHVRYLVFYLLVGLSASLIHILVSPSSRIPTVGASGAISGVLGAYLILFPRAKVIALIVFGFFFRLVRVNALIILGFWIVYQLIFGIVSIGAPGAVGGTAWFAHIGGFFAGVALVKLFARKPKAPETVDTLWQS